MGGNIEMAVKETIVKGRKFRKLIDEANRIWQRISFWTSASDVEFDDGKNAEDKVSEIIDRFGGLTFGLTSDGKPGWKKDGADTVTPFKDPEEGGDSGSGSGSGSSGGSSTNPDQLFVGAVCSKNGLRQDTTYHFPGSASDAISTTFVHKSSITTSSDGRYITVPESRSYTIKAILLWTGSDKSNAYARLYKTTSDDSAGTLIGELTPCNLEAISSWSTTVSLTSSDKLYLKFGKNGGSSDAMIYVLIY